METGSFLHTFFKDIQVRALLPNSLALSPFLIALPFQIVEALTPGRSTGSTKPIVSREPTCCCPHQQATTPSTHWDIWRGGLYNYASRTSNRTYLAYSPFTHMAARPRVSPMCACARRRCPPSRDFHASLLVIISIGGRRKR